MKTRARLVRSLGLIAIIGALAFPVTDLIAILLRQGYNPLSDTISSLALGPTSWIQSIGFYFGGIGTMAFAVGLFLRVSLIFVAIFHANLPGQAATIHGDIHLTAAFATGTSVLPAFFLISPAVRHRKTLFIYTIIAGILEIVMVIGRGNMPSDWALVGLHERLIAANAVSWMIISSWVILVRAKAHHIGWGYINKYENSIYWV